MRTKKEKIKLNIKNRKPITKELIYNSTLNEISKLCYQYNDKLKEDSKQILYKDEFINIIFYNYYWNNYLRIIIEGDNTIYANDSIEIKYYYDNDSISIDAFTEGCENIKKANLGIIKISSLVKHFARERDFVKNYSTDKHFAFKYTYVRDRRLKITSLNEKVSSTKRLYLYSLYLFDRLELKEKIDDLKMKIKDKELTIKSYQQRIKFYSVHPHFNYPVFCSEKEYQKEITKANKSIGKLKKDISSIQEDMSKVQDKINQLKVNNYYANASESH